MINGLKIVVILPAYNAEKTLQKTYDEIPFQIVDDVVMTDDFSNDNTVEVAKKIGIKHILEHDRNEGYGANQKSCYGKAISLHADIIVMLHPDYQYTPKLIPTMCELIENNTFDVVLGSRILGKGALKGGMPLYKFISNRVLTFIQNLLMNQNLSEYHTGFRCYKSEVLKKINFAHNSNDFVFDNQILAQICYNGYRIGEIPCPTKYNYNSSSINFFRSLKYGIGVVIVAFQYFFSKLGLSDSIFK